MVWLRPGARGISALVAGFLSFAALPAFSVGPYTDVSATSAFIRAPHEPGLIGSITRANSQGEGASLFDIAGFFPVRSSFLIQLETSYITLARGDEVIEGFGDALLWLKARTWTGDRKALFLESCVRFGVGSTQYFPYSTASTDVEALVAFVDSLGFDGDEGTPPPSRFLSYWIAAGGTLVLRLNDRLEAEGLHDDHASVGGGILVTFSRRFEIEIGGRGLFFGSGAAREIYFSQITAALSPATDLLVTVQGERGDWQERAIDASAGVGLTVRY